MPFKCSHLLIHSFVSLSWAMVSLCKTDLGTISDTSHLSPVSNLSSPVRSPPKCLGHAPFLPFPRGHLSSLAWMSSSPKFLIPLRILIPPNLYFYPPHSAAASALIPQPHAQCTRMDPITHWPSPSSLNRCFVDSQTHPSSTYPVPHQP